MSSIRHSDYWHLWSELYDDPTLSLITPGDSSSRGVSSLSMPPPLQITITDRIKKSNRNTPNNERSTVTTDNKLINPLGKLNSPFIKRGIILANIDAVFRLLDREGGYMERFSPSPLVFCSLNDAPGGFTQYIQWRAPNAFGYGISATPEINGQAWKTDKLDTSRVQLNGVASCYPDDGSGDLVSNADQIVNWIKEKALISPTVKISELIEGRGVNLVIADGDTYQSVVAEILIGLRILWSNGNMVIRIPHLISRMSQIIYMVALVFDSTTLFKPISSSPGSSELFLVAKGYQPSVLSLEIIGHLRILNDLHVNGKHDNYNIEIPNDFNQQIEYHSQMSKYRIDLYNDWLASRPKSPYRTIYTSLYWNIPS